MRCICSAEAPFLTRGGRSFFPPRMRRSPSALPAGAEDGKGKSAQVRQRVEGSLPFSWQNYVAPNPFFQQRRLQPWGIPNLRIPIDSSSAVHRKKPRQCTQHTSPASPEVEQEGVEVRTVPLLLPWVLLYPKVKQARSRSTL